MPILTIRHLTTYHYKHPVAFGEHRMMLRPRDDDDQKVLESELEITPEPSQLAWTQDIFGNHVAIARFAGRASQLRFESTIRVEHTPAGFGAADIEDLREPIRLPTPWKTSPIWRASSCLCPGHQGSIAGRPGSSGKTGRPTLASFLST
jgi:transglutaminase-like putative cysteine protease